MTQPAHSDGIAGFRRARVRVSDHVTDPIPVPNASERLRAQDEIEIELRVVEAVFLVQLGTAAVGPDAGLHVIHAHHRRIRRLQLAVVSLGGQLLLGVRQRLEVEGVVTGTEHQQLGVIAGDARPIAVVMVAVLLRLDIGSNSDSGVPENTP